MLSNESGNYSFPTLEPGQYKVSVELTGFRTSVRDGIDVLVNTTVRADLALQPGAVNESIIVTAENRHPADRSFGHRTKNRADATGRACLWATDATFSRC